MKALGDSFEHGHGDGPSCVVPVNGHSEVSLAITIVGALAVFAENIGEVFGMFPADILDAKIVHS